MKADVDVERRFGGVGRLYGTQGLKALQTAHVVVIGIGGVGSWAAEALARNAIGHITLIDLDNIAESNVNRQIHALEGAFGKAKVSAMRERILAINPLCHVHEIEDFITPDNITKLLDFHYDCILDCVDDAKAKIALAAFCKAKQIPLIMSGSAGGRLDATQIKTADLSAVQGDKLLAKVRNQLRRDHQFPKASNQKKSAKFGVTCVYSDEQVLTPNSMCEVENSHDKTHNIIDDALEANIHKDSGDAKNARADPRVNTRSITGLNCAGYGSSVCVTATFGFVSAGLVLQQLLG
jgi:tRNA threonylcarbamoyladenosine dehydratase